MLAGGQLSLGWLRRVSFPCHNFSVWSKSVNLARHGKIKTETPQARPAPHIQTDIFSLSKLRLLFVFICFSHPIYDKNLLNVPPK